MIEISSCYHEALALKCFWTLKLENEEFQQKITIFKTNMSVFGHQLDCKQCLNVQSFQVVSIWVVCIKVVQSDGLSYFFAPVYLISTFFVFIGRFLIVPHSCKVSFKGFNFFLRYCVTYGTFSVTYGTVFIQWQQQQLYFSLKNSWNCLNSKFRM